MQWGKIIMDIGQLSWWIWPIILFGFTLIIGLIAPLSGVGGGVLFVPLATAFLPFNVDFVRATGLIVALVSALSSTPRFAREGLANIKIVAPIAIVSIITSVVGAMVGLWVTNAFPEGKYYITVALGAILFFVFAIMITSKGSEFPEINNVDPLSKRLDLTGKWVEPISSKTISYKTTKLPTGIAGFSAVGFIAGMFGLGAGWANVPVLNLIMRAPIKVAAATSMAIITLNDGAATWVYIAKGATLPLIIIPSVVGMAIGARVSTRLAIKAKPRIIRYLVLGIMLFAAVADIYKGLQGIM